MMDRKRPYQVRKSHHTDYSKRIDVLSEDELFAIINKSRGSALVLILDSIQDPHNLGACLRCADAAGVDVVVAPKNRSVSITDTVRHVASGAAENVPFAQVTNLVRTMNRLKDAGLWLVGTSDEAEKCIYDVDLTGPIALVMGSEEKGLRRLTIDNCDFLAYIPMQGVVECLNVSVAAGICLFEAVKQRRQY